MQTPPTTRRRGPDSARGPAAEDHPRTAPDPPAVPDGPTTQDHPKYATPGSRFAMRNWRVRTRLLAAVLIPISATLLLGGLRVNDEMGAAENVKRVRRLVDLAERTTALAHELQTERDLSAVHAASDRRRGQGPLIRARAAVDRAAAAFRAQADTIEESFSPLVRSKLATTRQDLSTLGRLRNSTLHSPQPALALMKPYTAILTNLLAIDVEISAHANNPALAQDARALDALSRAKERTANERAVLGSALVRGRFSGEELDTMILGDQQRETAVDEFRQVAQPAQRARFEATVAGPDTDRAARIRQQALAQANAAQLNLPAEDYLRAVTAEINKMRTMEAQTVAALQAESRGLQATAQRFAALVSVLILAIVALGLGATLMVARSMVRPLHALRRGALEVADQRLPAAIRVLEESDGSTRPQVAPTGIATRDEIGQVARAVDQVHREAVRLAADQAALRGGVNAMVLNLSRRGQRLVERQLRLIDSLETRESDPESLAGLLTLDHLATRMRRHGENLLVLAGEEPKRRRSEPVPLIDLLRAAASEVEQYARVDLRELPNSRIAGRAVNDLVHLVAELLENATTFSSPQTRVLVTSQLLHDGKAMIEVEDRGIGMPPAELAESNERLLRPAAVDPSVARRMGLFVVSRLAERHQIHVQLRRSTSGGITAVVVVPGELLVLAAGEEQRGPAAESAARVTLSASPASPIPRQVASAPEGDGAGLLAVPLPVHPNLPAGAGGSQWGNSPSISEPVGSFPPGSCEDTVVSRVYRGDLPPGRALDPDTPLGEEVGGDRLPIFEAIESEWFRHRVNRRSFGTTVDKRAGRHHPSRPDGEPASPTGVPSGNSDASDFNASAGDSVDTAAHASTIAVLTEGDPDEDTGGVSA